MTTPSTITTLALHRAARSCVRASVAYLMGYGMQGFGSKKTGKPSKAELNFINGPGDQTTRMFVAGALLT